MAEGTKSEDAAGAAVVTITETVTVDASRSPNVVLKLTKSNGGTDRRVQWDQNTVDNEFMNKKKSKCCCIYTKPKAFDESDSEDSDDEHCTHLCRGHGPKDYKHNHGNQTTREPAVSDLEDVKPDHEPNVPEVSPPGTNPGAS